MKATGIVRKVDELGRIVLPIELRRTLDIMEKDSIEVFLDGKLIVLRKYELSCTFCGEKRICFPSGAKTSVKAACEQSRMKPGNILISTYPLFRPAMVQPAGLTVFSEVS